MSSPDTDDAGGDVESPPVPDDAPEPVDGGGAADGSEEDGKRWADEDEGAGAGADETPAGDADAASAEQAPDDASGDAEAPPPLSVKERARAIEEGPSAPAEPPPPDKEEEEEEETAGRSKWFWLAVVIAIILLIVVIVAFVVGFSGKENTTINEDANGGVGEPDEEGCVNCPRCEEGMYGSEFQGCVYYRECGKCKTSCSACFLTTEGN
ncbi:hypothetical protein ACHAXT_012691 [Thalassiosira profunda]